jgi:hypothetical protein
VLEVAQAFGGPVEMVQANPGRADVENDPTRARELGWAPTMDIMDYIRQFKASL